jgi:hypothetical protein
MRWTMCSLLAVALFLLASAPVPSGASGNSAQDDPLLYEIETDFLAYTLLVSVEIAVQIEILDGPAAVPEGAVVPREWGSIEGLYG